MSQRIDHYVADETDSFPSAPFFEEMFDGAFLGDGEVVGQRVGEIAVNLFRNGMVKTLQASLGVGDADIKLYGHQSDRDGRLDIAYTEHQVRLALAEEWFHARFKISTVCTAWELEPTSRLT
jgi:hypothetical protein